MAPAAPYAHSVRAVAVLLLSFVSALAAQAAEQRYDYDPLGRLIRSVEGSQANEYLYDPAGNLLQVIGGAVQPPVITSGDLGDFRRNAYRQVAVSGQNLFGAAIRPSHSGIRIDRVTASATAISFRVGVAPDTPLGSHQLVFSTAAGSVSIGLNVVPGLAITFEPLPIAVPPDNQARKYTVRLSEPSSQDKTFSLSTLSSAIAKAKTGSVTIPAGQTTADFGVIGVTPGTTMLSASSSMLVEPYTTMVTVASGAGTQLVYSRPLGITRGVPWALPASGQTFSKSVGVVRGAPWIFAEPYPTFAIVGVTRGTPFQTDEDNTAVSKSVGIMRTSPFAQPEQTLVVSPPVGVTKP